MIHPGLILVTLNSKTNSSNTPRRNKSARSEIIIKLTAVYCDWNLMNKVSVIQRMGIRLMGYLLELILYQERNENALLRSKLISYLTVNKKQMIQIYIRCWAL